MPEMTTLCQDGTGTPPTVFGSRAQQAAPQESSQNFYSQPAGNSNNGYSQPHTLPPHPSLQSHYSNSDGYGSFQPGQSGPQHQMDFHHHHIQQYQQQQHQHHPQQQHQYHQQFPPSHLQPQHHWGYGMNGTDIRGGSGEDHWGHGYYFHQTNGYHAQNPYGYQYRTPQHPGMDYGSPLHMTNEADRHNGGEEGESPSPHSDEDGEGGGDAPGCGPNNQGAKSLRPPYEWMKPSPSLPQPGKTRTKDKYRVVYSDHQRLELEKEFHFSKYITIRRKSEIAGQLGLSERQVKIWFQNRRAKERKQNKKREDQAVTSQTGQSPGINGDGNCKPDIIGSSSFLGDGSLSHDMNSHHLEQHHHLHQHMALSSAQEEESHSHSFIPKLEVKEEDIAVKQEHQHQHQHRQQQQPQPMANHNGTPLLHGPYLQTTLSPRTTPNAMTNHASLRTPPTMSTPTNPHATYRSLGMQLGRNLQHGRVMPTMDRYNSPNGNFGVSTSTPTQQGPEEMAYRLPVASAADSSGNSMNLSGSSDSGIMS